jgi:hypothetical protein
LALGLYHRGSLESVDRFYFRAETVLATFRFHLDNRVGPTVSADRMEDTGVDPRGALQCKNGGIQGAVFVSCHGRGPKRQAKGLFLFVIFNCTRYVNILQ